MIRVVVVQHRLLHYREELFEQMKAYLANYDIRLDLIHGQASNMEATRFDEGRLSWATTITNIFLPVGGVELIWQSLPSAVMDCDLLILIQENRILSNYYYISRRRMLGRKTSFWGHGRNLQSRNPTGLSETWKKKWLNSVDWWFAYTRSTMTYLAEQSFPADHISCLDNATDTKGFKSQLASVSETDIAKVKSSLNIPDDSFISIYCRSLYKEKRIELMVQAAQIIKGKKENFYLIVIGEGPDSYLLHQASQTSDWLFQVGVKRGIDKAVYYRMAKLVLNPGLVGLHILDAFCSGIPLVTTRDALHSPEYSYLQHNVNGLILLGTPSAYANGILDLLEDEPRYSNMSRQSLSDSNKYTVERMTENFCKGIVECLSCSAK